jgi:hypothetical protein
MNAVSATFLCLIFVQNLGRPHLASTGCSCINCKIFEQYVMPFLGVGIGTEKPMTEEEEEKQLDRQQRKVCDSAFDLPDCACKNFLLALVLKLAGDFPNAEREFNAAFAGGIQIALEKCALMFLKESERLPEGMMKEQMLQKAIHYLHKAIEATNSSSCLRLLGIIIHNSDPDPNKSLKFLFPAAELGDPLSMSLLIKMAKVGGNEKALKWIKAQLKMPMSDIYNTLYSKWTRS